VQKYEKINAGISDNEQQAPEDERQAGFFSHLNI
jgi:hypothetical protein